MAGSTHSDPHQQDGSSNPVRLAIAIGIGTLALIIGIVLLTKLAVGMYGTRSLEGDPSMQPKAVAQRIAPVAQVVIDPNAPPPAAAAAPAPAPVAAVTVPPPPAKGSAGAAAAGKSTYDSACAACHAAGVAGAPKLGDKAAWAPRLKAGKDQLYASAIKGKGAMPPKGGQTALSDDAVKAAVDYMTSSVQ
ncbi:MAG TPA: c-type cytochrome [Usitatibacter sp.]|nr:c-type cytochrome [Usitatibacter sp.]